MPELMYPDKDKQQRYEFKPFPTTMYQGTASRIVHDEFERNRLSAEGWTNHPIAVPEQPLPAQSNSLVDRVTRLEAQMAEVMKELKSEDSPDLIPKRRGRPPRQVISTVE